MSYLHQLMGKTIDSISTEVEHTYALNEPIVDYTIELPITISIEDFALFIYNPIRVEGLDKSVSLEYFKGLTLNRIDENELSVNIEVEDGVRLVIDLRNESYKGPEAMCLYGPDNLIVVW